MNRKKVQMLDRVFGVLDKEKVSDDRIMAFREAAALFNEWRRAGGDEAKE